LSWLTFDDLIPGPDSDGEGAHPGVQDDVGAIIGAGKAYPDERGVVEDCREFIRQRASRTVFARQRRAGVTMIFKKFWGGII
jgi:hypothetical protein